MEANERQKKRKFDHESDTLVQSKKPKLALTEKQEFAYSYLNDELLLLCVRDLYGSGVSVDVNVLQTWLNTSNPSQKLAFGHMRYFSRLSDYYVLLAIKSTENFLKEGELRWSDVLNREQYAALQKNRYYVLGGFLLSKHTKVTADQTVIRFIDIIDTEVRGFNLASRMIEIYECQNKAEVLLPEEIVEESAGYWAKQLNVSTSKDIDDLLKNYQLNEDEVDWKYLRIFVASLEKNITHSSSQDENDI